MNRPIKFRGRICDEDKARDDQGKLVYGDLRIIGIRPHIFKEAQCYYDEELIEVDPDSVAQLVGYDKDGREVYEGDTITNGQGYETTVQYGDNPDFVHLHKLTEA